MANETVENLAKEWAWPDSPTETHREDARFFLCKIANALERGMPMEHWSGWESAVGWLRAQAGEVDDG